METSARRDLTEFQKHWEPLFQESLASLDHYFNCYAHIGIHEEMIKDHIRTDTYRRAILDNRHLFADQIVLDIGAGTGILSLFAATAGAKHVYAVECSEIAAVCRAIVIQNKLQDKITVLQGKAEEIELPVPHVDIIISEWMGYCLLYENVLATILSCRDRWLCPNGLLFPDQAQLYVAGIEDSEYKREKVGYWKNVYGFDLSPVKKCVLQEPLVDTVDSNYIVTNSAKLFSIDLRTAQLSDLTFASRFTIAFTRKDLLHALVLWFDVTFSACHKPITFTTSPFAPQTHWKQTVIYLENVIVAEKGEALQGILAFKRGGENPRDLDIKLGVSFHGVHGVVEDTHYYRLR